MAPRPTDEDGSAALVRRARQGDAAAWEALYRRAYPRLLGFARRQLATDDAAEAVSETMTRAVASIERYTPTGSGFDAWLFGILRHVIVDSHRGHGRAARLGGRSERDRCECDATESLVAADEAELLRAALARLRPAERELLELRVVGGLSSDEAATVLGMRPGAVRMAQARALQRLRGFLAELDQ